MDEAGKPTVLHGTFSTWLPWHQPFLYDLVAGLAEEFRPVVLCNRVENLGRFPIAEPVRLKTRALLQPSAAVVVASHLRERHAPDLLHAHFGWSGLRMLLLAPLLERPLIVTFGGRDAGVQLRDPAMAPLYEVLLAMSDQVVCVSAHLREVLAGAGVSDERLTVVHRGTDLTAFPFVARGQRPAASVRLLMIGRLVEKKGHADALDALARLTAAGQQASLVVLGEGPAAGALAERARELGISDRVELTPPTDRAGVRAALEEADVFVHCSRTARDGDVEGIPNVVVEAAATGLPVVGTRHGGIPESIDEGRTGLLVPENDAGSLTDALARLVSRRDERLDLGRGGRQKMEREFDASSGRAAYARLYRQAIAAGADRVRQRAALPEDFVERARRALGVRKMGWEWPVARVVAEICLDPTALDPASDPQRGVLDRAFEARTAGPRLARSGADLVVDLARRTPLRGAAEGLRRRSHERVTRLDQRLLEQLRAGALTLQQHALLEPALADLQGEPAEAGKSLRRRLRTLLAGAG